MADQLTFLGWVRPPGHDLVSAPAAGGRLPAGVNLTIQDADNHADQRTRQVTYDLLGPRDATGLAPSAVLRSYPSPGAQAVEADKAVYVELAAADLPWRYTLDRPRDKALQPWLVLLVGTADEIEVRGTVARVQPPVLDAHPLSDSARQAHVEQDASGRGIARLISPRALVSDRDHVAVVVPAYTPQGTAGWPSPATSSLELPAHFSWTFHTKAGGDFAALARRLTLVTPGADLGSARVEYGPLPTADREQVRGALVAKANTPVGPLPNNVTADLRRLTKTQGNAAHPVVGLPDLGGAWAGDAAPAQPPGWRDALRSDFRSRAVAGLGERAGIRYQDMLAEQAGRIAGAHEEVADRLRRLAAGLLTSRSLWRRRVPADPARRLAVLGPALRDVLTGAGSGTPSRPVTAAMEHPDRALDRSMFSSAGQRAFRSHGAAAPGGAPGASGEFVVDPGQVLREAAAAPVPRPRSVTDAVHTDAFARSEQSTPLDEVTRRPAPDVRRLRTATRTMVNRLDRVDLDPDTNSFVDFHLSRVVDAMTQGRSVPILPLLGLIDGPKRLSRSGAKVLASALEADPDSEDLAALARLVTRVPRSPVTTGFDLVGAAAAIDPEFDPELDPAVGQPSITRRGLSDLVDRGAVLDAAPDGPVELAPDLDLAAWQFLRDDEAEWLLPGVGTLDDNTVVGLTTNPAFVDTFLLGLNAQVVAELRFRNYPLIPGWTPVRTFWDRANPSSGDTDDDIVGIDGWPTLSPFGDPSHQTASASSSDLVVLFSSSLFREYPGTVVSLVPVEPTSTGSPDWTKPLFDQRLLPTFLGRISADRTFFGFDLDPTLGVEHWVVLEETVKGRRFFNAATRSSNARNGADLAADTLSPPRRVMIRGDVLLAGLGS